jgi:hypothetical protein
MLGFILMPIIVYIEKIVFLEKKREITPKWVLGFTSK